MYDSEAKDATSLYVTCLDEDHQKNELVGDCVINLAKVLEKEGFIASYTVTKVEGKPAPTLEINLKYSEDRKKTIIGIKRVSKPGLRIYKKSDQMPKVLGGVGVAVVSTSHGLMTDREARKAKLGGEVLCYVW